MSIQSRRQLLTNAVLAGAASLGGFTAWHDVQAAEGPLETATVRFMRQPAICHAPQFADSDEVARAFRDDVARDYEMMSPGFGASLARIL